MADITLSRPAAQTRQTVSSAAEDRFVFDFSTGDATLSRDGDNLILTFDDGGSLELTDFYTTYNKENIPDFVVDGAEISGADFFTAMNEPDLMPAAGPAAGAAAGNGARYHEYANSSLAEGLDHLNGLDWGMNRPPVEEIYRGAVGEDGRGAEQGEPGAPIASTPVNHTPDIDTPVQPTPPDPNPDHPGNNDPNHPAWIPGADNAHIVVDEGALPDGKGGSGQHNLHGYQGQHQFTVDVHGEPGGSIELTYDGQTVRMELPEDGATRVTPDGNAVLAVNGVEVTITGAELVDGKWQVSYEYELTGRQEHDRDSGNDTTLTGSISITVTDGTGDVAHGQLNVEVHDDVPHFSVEETTDATPKLDGSFNLNYGADGEAGESALTADGATKTEVNGDTTTFTFDDGELTVTKGNDGSYSYEFMPNDPNATFNKPITLTATDSDGDTDTVTLTVGKTVPVITPGTDPDPDNPGNTDPDAPTAPAVEVGKIVVDEGVQPEHGGEVHGKEGSGSFVADLNGEDGTITIGGLTITIRDGQVAEVTGSASENGVKLSIDADGVSLTDDGKWKVNYEYELTGSQTHGADGSATDETLSGKFDITVTDASGDIATGQIAVEVHDDVPTITTGGYTSHPITDPTPQISFDFRQENFDGFDTGWNSNKTGFSRVEQDSVQIFASNVKYTYAEDGSLIVDQVYDENGHSLEERNPGQLAGNYGKLLSISEDGLGVGNKWGGDDLAMKPGDSTLSEALVLETKNGSVSYGMNLEFGRFEDGDKALVTFMLTPRNNNDDTVVFSKVVSYSDLVNGKIHIDVPDGFTKVFISALPGEDNHDSAFTVKTLEMTRPSWEHEGAFSINPGADGVADADGDGVPDSFTWDVDLGNFGNPPKVVVKDAPGSGEYLLVKEQDTDPNVMIFKLSGKPNGENGTNLDGNALFIVRVDPTTGKWTIDQFYKFDLENGDKPIFDLNFQVTDGDGDVAHASQTVNADLSGALDRFQNVVDDTFNGTDTKNDTHASILTGTEVNDLMYGRGGNDILFGDAGNDFEGHLRTELTAWGKPAADYLQIWSRLNNSKPNANVPGWNLELESILERLEAREGNGGDDALFGGLGNDILFGGAGNDYLYGNGKNKEDATTKFTDRDMLFGGSGNDILVYDANDAIIHGGRDTDILLAGSDAPSLAEMMDSGNGSGDRPYVGGIEVLLKSMGTTHVENLGITSLKTLKNYGIEIENNMLVLGAAWSQIGNIGGNLAFERTLEDGSTLRLETTLGQDKVQGDYTRLSPEDAVAQTAVFTDDADAAVAAASGADHVAQQDADGDVAPGAADPAPAEALPFQAAMSSQPADLPRAEAGASAARPQAVSGSEADAADTPDAALDDFLAHVDELDGKDGETLFGSDAGDFLAGAEGQDYIYAGAGDDLIVYDPTDYLIHGGDGIDVLLGGADLSLSLEDMLQATDTDNGPIVKDVEVLIKGVDALGLTSMDELAEKLGVTIDHDKGTMTLTGWTRGESVTGADGKTYTTYTNGDVTLETTLTTQTETAGEAEGMVQQFTLQTING